MEQDENGMKRMGRRRKTHIEIGTVPSSMRLPHKLVKKWKLFEWEHLSACKCLCLCGRSEWSTHTHTHAVDAERRPPCAVKSIQRCTLSTYEIIFYEYAALVCAHRLSPIRSQCTCRDAHCTAREKQKMKLANLFLCSTPFFYFNLYLWRLLHYSMQIRVASLFLGHPLTLKCFWSTEATQGKSCPIMKVTHRTQIHFGESDRVREGGGGCLIAGGRKPSQRIFFAVLFSDNRCAGTDHRIW